MKMAVNDNFVKITPAFNGYGGVIFLCYAGFCAVSNSGILEESNK